MSDIITFKGGYITDLNGKIFQRIESLCFGATAEMQAADYSFEIKGTSTDDIELLQNLKFKLKQTEAPSDRSWGPIISNYIRIRIRFYALVNKWWVFFKANNLFLKWIQ